MAQNVLPNAQTSPTENPKSKWTVQRIVFLSSGILGGLIAIIFVVGLLLAFSGELEITALRIQYIRNLFMIVMAGGALSHSAYLEGQLRYAERIARQVLEDAKNMRGNLPEPASISLVTLALVHLMRNEVDLALRYLDQAGDVDPNPTSSNMPILLVITRAKIQILLGKFDEALNLLQIGRELQNRHPAATWTDQDLNTYIASVSVRRGDFCGGQDILDGSVYSATHPLSQLVQAEIHYGLHKPEAVEVILHQLLAENSHGLHYEPLFDARILLSLALFQQHKIHQACQTIVETIRKAAPERILLPFLERGAELTTLLALVLETENISREAKAFIRELLSFLPQTNGTTRMDGLTLLALSTAASISPREQEILTLTSAGLSVREMAHQLCIAESTVKTHLINIYQKLGARSRTQAINRAMELELIKVSAG